MPPPPPAAFNAYEAVIAYEEEIAFLAQLEVRSAKLPEILPEIYKFPLTTVSPLASNPF